MAREVKCASPAADAASAASATPCAARAITVITVSTLGRLARGWEGTVHQAGVSPSDLRVLGRKLSLPFPPLPGIWVAISGTPKSDDCKCDNSKYTVPTSFLPPPPKLSARVLALFHAGKALQGYLWQGFL